jgi:hypothetical protein
MGSCEDHNIASMAGATCYCRYLHLQWQWVGRDKAGGRLCLCSNEASLLLLSRAPLLLLAICYLGWLDGEGAVIGAADGILFVKVSFSILRPGNVIHPLVVPIPPGGGM